MFSWWNDFDTVATFGIWMQGAAALLGLICAFAALALLSKGKRLLNLVAEKDRQMESQVKAAEKSAVETRKQLQQARKQVDAIEEKRRLAEMDAEALRKELDRLRQKFTAAQQALKSSPSSASSASQTLEAENDAQEAVLEPKQVEILIKTLKNGPKGELDIVSLLGNETSLKMARELHEILSKQGWMVSQVIESAFSSEPEGIILAVHSKQTAPSYATFLQRAFTTIGLEVSARSVKKYREWSLTLIVGKLEI